MQQVHINIIKDRLAKGELILLHPKPLQVGRARFANPETGMHEHYEVVKYKHL